MFWSDRRRAERTRIRPGGPGTDVAPQIPPGPCADDISREEVTDHMTWETPEFVEIKMDAEVSAYQQDI
jgi:hypothetical protein